MNKIKIKKFSYNLITIVLDNYFDTVPALAGLTRKYLHFYSFLDSNKERICCDFLMVVVVSRYLFRFYISCPLVNKEENKS